MDFNSRPMASRREFLKQAATTGSGVVVVHYLDGQEAWGAQGGRSPKGLKQPVTDNFRSHRYEGRAKVMGAKIYGRDFRAKDLKGWPEVERRTVIIRAPLATKVFRSVDLERLSREYGGPALVTGDDLANWGVEAGLPFLMPTFYVRSGAVPDYLGQPVALLSFTSTSEYLAVKSKLQDVSGLLQWGEDKAPNSRPPYGTTRFVRYEGANGQEEFSFVKDGPWSPPWEESDPNGSPNARASAYTQRIESDLTHPDWRIFQQIYETQSVDPMFMEPECGLSWYESESQTLHLTLGTQSPQDDGDAILHFFSKATTPPIKKVAINCCYPGGGFGGRDSSDFPLHLAIAAMAEPDVAHRIIHSRYDQFQSGIKRHPSKVDLLVALDQKGKLQALKSIMELDGGGQNNYSFAVQNVGARNASGGYRFPRSWVDAVSRPSVAIPAGSVRGFGSFQSSFALECLLDEAAETLGIDAIDLRLNNILSGQDHAHTGAGLAYNIRIGEVLRAARKSRLWQGRHGVKAKGRESIGGVGFALGVKSFGKNPGDAVVAAITLDHKGRLLLMTNSVDMGNGTATTLPLSLVDILGRPADDIKLGATIDFGPLELVGPKAKDEAHQQELAKNPFWVPYKAMSTAASAGAYTMRHAAREAAKVLMEWGIWPAACAILGLKAKDTVWDPQAVNWSKMGLVYKKMRPIAFEKLAKKAHDLGVVTGAMVHGFYRTRWARASFPIDGKSYESEIDGLALRRGGGEFRAVARSSVDFPPYRTQMEGANRYTPYGVVVAVEVSRNTGEVKVVDAETFLDCGPVTLMPIVEGQMEGGFAMGIGQALTESFPLTDGGPGQGDWNLHRYRVPLAGDCAVGRAKFHILPSDPQDEPRGMAEVVFNPVPAAIVNALAHATGKRLRRLPLTPDAVKAALR